MTIQMSISTLEFIQDHIEIREFRDRQNDLSGLDRIENALRRLKYVTEAEHGHLNYIDMDFETMNFDVAKRRHAVLMDKIMYTYKRYQKMAINKLDKERVHHTTTASACNAASEYMSSGFCRHHYITVYRYFDPAKGHGWVTSDKGLRNRKISPCYTVFKNGKVIDLRQNGVLLSCPNCHAPKFFPHARHDLHLYYEYTDVEFDCDGCSKSVKGHDWKSDCGIALEVSESQVL